MRPIVVAAILALVAPLALAGAPAVAQQAAPIQRIKTASGIEIGYRIAGPATGRPLLLIAGTGMQLIEWPPELIQGLVKRGFRVIAFDNRDSGESTHYTAAGMPDWAGIFAALGGGKAPPLAYAADDMARDAVELLDALGVRQADLFGISGGATIAQLVALAQPDRVRTVTLIAANSGNPALPLPAKPARLAAVPQPQADWKAEQLVDRQVAMSQALAGSGSAFDAAAARKLAQASVARDADPLGFARQGAAMIVLGDLRARQAKIAKPSLVIHGDDDPLISPDAGREVAGAIPGARFVLIPGMGHDVPRNKVAAILALVEENARRAP